MEYRYRNITALGLLVLVAGGLFAWGFFYLMGDPILTGGTEIAMTLQDGGGLKRGDQVHLNGVQVGTVRDVELVPPSDVTVTLRIDSEMRLPADTRAVVRGDVFGAHVVTLVPGQALVNLERGDTIRGVTAQALPELASDLGDQTRILLGRADSLLSPATVSDVKATATVLPEIARELRSAFSEFRLAAASLRRTTEEVEDAQAGVALTAALNEVAGSARSFNTAATTLNRAAVSLDESLLSLSSVLGKIDRGEGTMGLLVNDTTLYGELRSTLAEMRALTADVRANPKKYVTVEIF